MHHPFNLSTLRLLAPAVACTAFAPAVSTSPLSAGEFLRGDANLDQVLDLADAVTTLSYLFAGGPPAACPDAADVDDSGGLDIADPVRVLSYLFRAGAPPSAPFPAGGFDPTPDDLGCGGEPDAADGALLAADPGDAAEIDAAQAPGGDRSLAGASGDALMVDAGTFQAVVSLPDGASLTGALGPAGSGLLAAILGGPAEGPRAAARDLILRAGADGCAEIPPQLLDAGSRSASGTFIRGDLDGDGKVTEDDAARLAGCFKSGCPELGLCWDRLDANDDGIVSLDDVAETMLAAIGEITLPPPGASSCQADPTADSLPACAGGWCAAGAGLSLRVEPPVVCGRGAHPVTLVASDGVGEARAPALVTICILEDESCEPTDGDTGDTKSQQPVCRWIYSRDLDPETAENELNQRVYDSSGATTSVRDQPPLVAGGAMEVWRTDLGPGPDHALTADRLRANCFTPPTELSLSKSGTDQLRLAVVCVRPNGMVAACEATAEIEGLYRSTVEAGTSAGPGCLSGPNRVEALAQDETSLHANGSAMFAKAVSVQNGNQVTTTPTVGIDIGVANGPLGPAASPAFKFGYSQTTVHRTGKSQDQLSAFGNTSVKLPLTLSLYAKGRIDVQAHLRTWARAKTATVVSGYWLVARASCAVPPLYLEEIQGEEGARAEAHSKAEQFRKTRLGR